MLQYEHGSRMEKADFAVKYYVDSEYRKLIPVQYQPHSQKELKELLQKEQQKRESFQEGDPSSYIENL